jgi:hypothetical protein
MKKLLIIAFLSLVSSASFYSCKSSHDGNCATYGGSGALPVKHVGKSI